MNNTFFCFSKIGWAKLKKGRKQGREPVDICLLRTRFIAFSMSTSMNLKIQGEIIKRRNPKVHFYFIDNKP